MSLEDLKEALVTHQKTLLAGIVKQITECAYFILDYAKDTNFWRRTFRNTVISEVDARRQAYLDKLEELKKDFQGHAVVTTEVTVFRVLDTVEDILNDLKEHDIDSKLETIPYVGAGFQPDNEGCLPGTREAFLKDVEEWVNDLDSEQRVCVIFGQAGTGKSSIAHEVARRFGQLKRLGSSFCFNRVDQTTRSPQRLVSNLARDLAYCDPHFKQALYRTIRDGTHLRHQDDIAWQLENLILQPMREFHVVGPLVLVIDALDESGDEGLREKMLAILANRLANLPACFRIVITSRAEPDITDIFDASDVSKHIRFLRMDDNSLAASTSIDILAYIRSRRDKSNAQLQMFLNEDRCQKLANKSEGLFQWASVACKHLAVSVGGLTISDIFENLVEPSANGTHLDALYKQVLQQHFVMSNPRVERRFKSVMGRVLAAFEPLSLWSLAELHPPEDDPEPYDGVKSVVGHLSSLLSGVHDSAMPIRPLHTSFRDFLVNKQYSLEFYINPRDHHSDLAFACLRTLNTNLKFNPCELETSYALNKDMPKLKQRVGKSITPSVTYACRFWAQHLRLSRFNIDLYNQVHRFLFDKLLFWFEALSLLREVGTANFCSGSKPSASYGRLGLQGLHWTMATDAYNFVLQFGACIAQSAPHVYLSALPFSPEASHVFKQYGSRFPRIPRVCTGQAKTWPQTRMTITGHKILVLFVSFSPDGKHVVSGSFDKTIRLWNGKHIASGSHDSIVRLWSTETGEAISTPLAGHTKYVASVAFSPDGKKIVSGSYNNTVRLWSSESGEAIGAPLEGHTNCVTSVAFSPDGKYIASGSWDSTIRLWSVHNNRKGKVELSDLPMSAKDTNAFASGIILSRNLSHALANPDILLGSPSPCENDPRDLLHRQEDGWLVGPESRLLLWIPAENRQCMHWLREDMLIGQHATELDLSDFAHGPNWHECYVGEDEDIHGGSEGNL
ncbi:hypothetical protein OF83DRAFT_1056097 [Amylostereum chailletii]|nr:hypothetical protein OF83DRAFT_1056097 [Amylostereum chailletii]